MRTTATGKLVIVGAVLPLLLGATLGSLTTDEGRGTWAYPMPSTAFLLLSVGLAVSHLLVALGYREVTRRAAAPGGRTWAAVACLGSVLVAACELWSGLVATTDLDAPVLTALDAGYAVTSVAVLLGTLGAGLALHRSASRLAPPLLLNGLLLLVAIPIRFLAGDGWGIAALTVWSLSYVWLGIRLDARESDARSSAAKPPPLSSSR